MHRSRVRRWQKKGELPFTLDSQGHAKFPRKHIEAMALALGHVVGAAALVHAKAFALFAKGKTWQDVVIALHDLGMAQPKEVVRALHAEFLEKEKIPALGPRRGKKAAPVEADGMGEEVADKPALSADAWERQQSAIHRRNQEAHDQRERDFEAQQAPKPTPVDAPPATTPKEPEDAGPLSDRILEILRILGRKPAT